MFDPSDVPQDQFVGYGASRLPDERASVVTEFINELIQSDGAYGMQSNTYGSATTPLQYAGQFTVAAGNPSLQYMGARWSNAQTMDWMSRDPVEATTNQPYLYVGDNPINVIDPLGLCDWWDPVCDAEAAGTAISQNVVQPTEQAIVNTGRAIVNTGQAVEHGLGQLSSDAVTGLMQGAEAAGLISPCGLTALGRVAIYGTVAAAVGALTIATDGADLPLLDEAGAFDLFHGTDLASALDITNSGIDPTAAAASGGGDVFWTTTDRSVAQWFAESNPAGGEPAVVGIRLIGGIARAVERGIMQPGDLAGTYLVKGWGRIQSDCPLLPCALEITGSPQACIDIDGQRDGRTEPYLSQFGSD